MSRRCVVDGASFVALAISIRVAPSPWAATALMMESARVSAWTLPVRPPRLLLDAANSLHASCRTVCGPGHPRLLVAVSWRGRTMEPEKRVEQHGQVRADSPGIMHARVRHRYIEQVLVGVEGEVGEGLDLYPGRDLQPVIQLDDLRGIGHVSGKARGGDPVVDRAGRRDGCDRKSRNNSPAESFGRPGNVPCCTRPSSKSSGSGPGRRRRTAPPRTPSGPGACWGPGARRICLTCA